MKVLKSLFLSVVLVFSAWSLNAQECESFDNMLQEGNHWVMTNYNKKDKEEGTIEYTVLKAYTKEGLKNWDMKYVIKDKKGKEVSSTEYTMTCDGNKFFVKADALLPAGTTEAYEDMEMEIDATNQEFPQELEVGQELPKSEVNITVGMNGMTISNMTVINKDRKVTAQEEITTDAGTFQTYKIEEMVVIKNKLVSRETRSVNYFVPGFWFVKQENYDKKGKLDSYSLLTKFERK